jgi:hypothetical protein
MGKPMRMLAGHEDRRRGDGGLDELRNKLRLELSTEAFELVRQLELLCVARTNGIRDALDDELIETLTRRFPDHADEIVTTARSVLNMPTAPPTLLEPWRYLRFFFRARSRTAARRSAVSLTKDEASGMVGTTHR